MKKIVLLILFFPAAVFAQNDIRDLFGDISPGDRFSGFMKKGDPTVPVSASVRTLPQTLSSASMSQYRIIRRNGHGQDASLQVYVYGKKIAILVTETDARQMLPDLLMKKYGPASGKVIYKNHDFNGSGCPTQEVCYWNIKGDRLYCIHMPELARYQWILTDEAVQRLLKDRESKIPR